MATVLTVAFTPTPVPAGVNVIVEASPMQSAGRSFVPRSSYRILSTLAAAAVSPTNLAAAYIAKYGALTVGAKIFFRLTPVNAITFEKGASVETSVIVA